jgi:hypothetical protein
MGAFHYRGANALAMDPALPLTDEANDDLDSKCAANRWGVALR